MHRLLRHDIRNIPYTINSHLFTPLAVDWLAFCLIFPSSHHAFASVLNRANLGLLDSAYIFH